MPKRLLLMVTAALCSVFASAQTVQPLFQPQQHFVDLSGNPCAGCKLYSYAAGTTTPQPTYVDASGTIPNTNPVILDAAGSAAIWMGQSSYKFALVDTYGTTLWTVDRVLAPFPGGQAAFLPLAGGTMSGSIVLAGNNLLNVGNIGVGTANPSWPIDVENGAINAGGFLYNASAPMNHILLGNGTYYVDSPTFPWSGLSGIPAFYYQTVQANKSPEPQETAVNFSSAFSLSDSSGAATNVDLASVATPGSCTYCSVTYDNYGRVTAASSGPSPGQEQYFTFAGCTAQNPYNGDAYCGGTATLPTAFADTNYFLTCTASTTFGLPTGTSPGVGYSVVTSINSSSSFTYGIGFIYSGGSPTAITPNVTCHAHHN